MKLFDLVFVGRLGPCPFVATGDKNNFACARDNS